MIALAILAIGATAYLELSGDSLRAIDRERSADREMAAAVNFFSAVSLWTADDFDHHLGSRREGPWILVIQRPAAALYDAELMDSSATHVLLRSSWFRPDSAS